MGAEVDLCGWRSVDRRHRDGSIDSEQQAVAARAVVERSEAGALELGRGYRRGVERSSYGLVRSRERGGGAELRLRGLGLPLLVFGPPLVTVTAESVCCSFEIRGGLLARRPGGRLELAQAGAGPVELRVAVQRFFPRLGVFYGLLERRFHVSVSRRYLRELAAEARR